MRCAAFLLLISSVAMAIGASMWGDFDLVVLDATPSSDVSIPSVQVDIVFDSPGNVRMGFGVEWGFATASCDFIEEPFDKVLGIYAVGVYKSEFISALDMLVVSRGGVVLPNLELSRMAYFTEVEVALTYNLLEKWFVSLGTSIKSYSFGKSYISFIPIKIGIGGDL